MLSFVKKLLGREYQPLNKIHISKQALLDNYSYLSSVNPMVKAAPVLKSNAYGHGIKLVAGILDSKPPFFCVDSLYEAYELLKTKIQTPVLVMGYIDPKSLNVKKLPFSYAVWDLEVVKALNKHQKGAEVHIFVDTGMNREGVKVSDLPEFLTTIKQYNNITISGLMTHLAEAEKAESELTKQQLKEFKKAYEIVRKMGFSLQFIHIGGSGALFLKLPAYINIVRTGIAIFGVEDFSLRSKDIVRAERELKPVLKLTTKLVQIKSIKKGDKVGYGGTFEAKTDTVVGILPIGYYDGVDRRLSSKGVVLIDNVECPILGRVSMNLTTVDLSRLGSVEVGKEVIVFSDNPEDKNSVKNYAEMCNTIPYDLLVHLAPSTKRVLS